MLLRTVLSTAFVGIMLSAVGARAEFSVYGQTDKWLVRYNEAAAEYDAEARDMPLCQEKPYVTRSSLRNCLREEI